MEVHTTPKIWSQELNLVLSKFQTLASKLYPTIKGSHLFRTAQQLKLRTMGRNFGEKDLHSEPENSLFSNLIPCEHLQPGSNIRKIIRRDGGLNGLLHEKPVKD